jgi:hypothetical protein
MARLKPPPYEDPHASCEEHVCRPAAAVPPAVRNSWSFTQNWCGVRESNPLVPLGRHGCQTTVVSLVRVEASPPRPRRNAAPHQTLAITAFALFIITSNAPVTKVPTTIARRVNPNPNEISTTASIRAFTPKVRLVRDETTNRCALPTYVRIRMPDHIDVLSLTAAADPEIRNGRFKLNEAIRRPTRHK